MWVCRRTSVCLCVCLYLWCGAFSTTTTTEEWRKECALKVHTNEYANTMNNAIRLPLRHAEIKWLAGVSKQQRIKFLSAKSRLALWCDAHTRYQIGFACDDRIFAVLFAAEKSSQFMEIAHEEFVFFHSKPIGRFSLVRNSKFSYARCRCFTVASAHERCGAGFSYWWNSLYSNNSRFNARIVIHQRLHDDLQTRLRAEITISQLKRKVFSFWVAPKNLH